MSILFKIRVSVVSNIYKIHKSNKLRVGKPSQNETNLHGEEENIKKI